MTVSHLFMFDSGGDEQNKGEKSDECKKEFSHFENENKYFENDVKIMDEDEVFIE